MSTIPRLPSAVAGAAPSIRTIWAHSPELRGRFDRMYATLWTGGLIGEDIKELVRLRNARITDCGL